MLTISPTLLPVLMLFASNVFMTFAWYGHLKFKDHSLPIVIMGAMMVLNPEYLNPLWLTKSGNLMVVGSAVWMGTGILIMRKMINFDF